MSPGVIERTCYESKSEGGTMSENQQINAGSVDLREEYVAAEKRLRLVLVTRIIWVILGLLEILWVISYRPRETRSVH
jgi:hypothetical protein